MWLPGWCGALGLGAVFIIEGLTLSPQMSRIGNFMRLTCGLSYHPE
jgi:hypothetical protein